MKEVEGYGKNIEQAIEDALFQLKAPKEDVDIKIMCEGGLFKKAKVLVSISEDVKEKYQQKEEKRKQVLKDEEGIIIKTSNIQEKQEDKEDKEDKKVLEEIKDEKTVELNKEKAEEKFSKIINPKVFLENVFSKFEKEITIEEKEDERSITYVVKGENISQFIGYRGESLSALSFLTSTVAGRCGKRILVDIEGYRERREESLRNLAKRTAEKVFKTGRYIRLEPMNPAERRIIHMALQENENVTTLSKGTEPRRYLMIFPREYKD